MVRPASSGASFGPFELHEELGRGGQGIVYRAHDARTRADVALKVLLHELRPDGRAETESWAALLRAQPHASLCPIHEVGEWRGLAYVSMALVGGEPWPRKPAPDDAGTEAWTGRAVELVRKVALALEHAHSLGVLHADLKPSNLRLVGDEPVVLDFTTTSASGHHGDPHARGGTVPYLAPEQLDGALGVHGPWTDVWALGVLLYEALDGAPPFQGPTDEACCHAILAEEPELDAGRWRTRPRALRAVLEKALAKDPGRRYRSAGELARDLERWRAGEPVEARRASVWARIGRWARREPALVACSALLGLSLVGWSALSTVRWLELAHAVSHARAARDLVSAPYLLEQERELWPAFPSEVPRMERWLADAREVLAGARGTEGPEPLQAGLEPLAALVPAVEGRIRRARDEAARSLEAHASAWEATCAEVRSDPRYGGLVLAPQVGLVPLGRDPVSGLQEFGHLASGELARRDPSTQRLLVDGRTGIVLVLLPGGTFAMGAERPDGTGQLLAAPCEGPVHAVELAPFFLAKHELTRGQWARLRAEVPPAEPAEELSEELAHPLSRVSWTVVTEELRRQGLVLPTEARWEFAARAGTRTAWSSGAERESLRGHANLADRAYTRMDSSARAGAPNAAADWPELDDGFAETAPVGRFAPNAFGLHDVHGNVSEIVLDPYGPYTLPVRAGDGLRLGGQDSIRIHRGGGFADPARRLRSAHRDTMAPESQLLLGLRAAREIL